DHDLLHTAYLKVTGNKVSAVVSVMSRDLVALTIAVEYRVDFEGADPSKWFAVDNYVKLLCDHASSIIKAAARRHDVFSLQTELTDIVRDALLGAHSDDAPRPGRMFAENNMRLRDVEVLELEVSDEIVADMLEQAQIHALEQAVEVTSARSMLTQRVRIAELEQAAARAEHEARALEIELARALADTRAQSELDSVRANGALEALRHSIE